MTAFDPALDKVVTGRTANPKDDLKIDARDHLAKVLGALGFVSITAGNTPPTDQDVLWWHIDLHQAKRYNAVLGNWYPLVASQFAMHLIRQAVLGAGVDSTVEVGDLFLFWDVSLKEVKTITRDNLMAALGATRTLTTQEGVKGGGTLGANRTISLDIPGLTTENAVNTVNDVVAFYDTSAAVHRKTTVGQFASIIRSANIGMTLFYSGT